MKNLFLLILISSLKLTFGQTAHLTIENVKKEADFSFPIIHSTDSLIEFKINTHLQLAELELMRGHEKTDIFEKVSINNGTIYGGKVDISYQELQNSRNVLAIKFNQSSCGMTCAFWVRYYNFNPQNGDRYYLQDFFDAENFTTFQRLLGEKRKQNLIAQVEQLEMGEDTAYFLEYMLPAIDNDNLEEFYFTKDSIYVDNENLLNKHDKFLDINHVTTIAISEIAPLLNEFGESALISANNLSDFVSNQEPQLYFGQIDDKYDFVMLFKPYYENEYYGVYAYLKYGIGINLDGKLTNKQYEFNEKNDGSETTGEITFKKENNQLIGTWSSKGSSESMTFKAKRK